MMKIDKMASAPDSVGRYRVHFDDGKIMRLYRQTVEDFGLYTGKELTDEQFRELTEAAGAMSAKMRAVRILSTTGVSKKDLQNRLVQKGETPRQAAEAVSWLEGLDLLDDAKTAQQLVERCIRKGFGPARAKQLLYEKRIPKEYWDDALRDYPDQGEFIYDYLQQKLPDANDEKSLKRIIDALLRKGHSYVAIRSQLQRFQLEWEDL